MIWDSQKYLRAYINRQLPIVAIDKLHSDTWGVYADCHLSRAGQKFSIRLLLPRMAPRDARPLLASVKIGRTMAWSYHEVFEVEQSWLDIKIRIHLYHLEGGLFQVHVKEGEPGKVVRVSRLTDVTLSIAVEALMKQQVARLWGLGCSLSRAEKVAIEKLSP